MYGICGWLGDVADAHESGVALDAMREDCGSVSGRGAPGLHAGDLHIASLDTDAADAGACVFSDERLAVATSERVRGASGKPLSAADLAVRYRGHGRDFLKRVRGPFAVVLYDRSEGKLILAVDRAGIRPLFVWRRGDTIAFSSRLEALRRIPGLVAEVDRQALFNYLYFHVVPAPGTIYTGCDKLLPAQMLIFSGSGRFSCFYWAMPYRDDNPAGFEALRAEFRDLLPRVVDRGAGELEAVGCFLSGGTDSSTVAGTLRRCRDTPIRTYSMGFQAEGFDEVQYARLAARHFKTDAREYYVKPQDVVDSIPGVAAYCDEPFGNASVVPAYLCARFAREEGTERMLAGDGGDEIFGGNARYANQWVFELYGRMPGFLRRSLIEPMVRGMPGADRLGALRKVRSYISQAKVPLPDRLETYNFLHRTPLGEIFDADFLAGLNTQEPLADLREVYDRTRSESSVNRMMHLDLKITLADNDLRKVNQACGLAGMDVRYPLLDDEMLEFAAGVPPQLQLRRTRLRYFFKRALTDFLPAEIIEKKKHGFGLPVGLWMAEFEPLRELAADSLSAFRKRRILHAAYLDWLERQHRSEHASYYGVFLWVLVMLEQWLALHGH
jgi:asparagine synthase (glutamine-hydrolysing)